MGSAVPLGDRTLSRLAHTFSSWNESAPNPLDGRVAVKIMALPETGPVVIKSYRRGGMMTLLARERYLRTGQTRSQREFYFLNHAAQAGVSVPRPLIYIAQGVLFYRAWLVTQEIKGHQSFATLASEDPARAVQLMPSISKNIQLLIKNNILHVDLHPGNVLIDEKGQSYIIDFDKARMTRYSTSRVMQLIQTRWKKAVSKYHLPPIISNLELD